MLHATCYMLHTTTTTTTTSTTTTTTTTATTTPTCYMLHATCYMLHTTTTTTTTTFLSPTTTTTPHRTRGQEELNFFPGAVFFSRKRNFFPVSSRKGSFFKGSAKSARGQEINDTFTYVDLQHVFNRPDISWPSHLFPSLCFVCSPCSLCNLGCSMHGSGSMYDRVGAAQELEIDRYLRIIRVC